MAISTHIGRLRYVVQIQQQTTQSSDMDGAPGKWSVLASVHADVIPVKGMEQETGAQVVATHDYRVVMRQRDDVTPGMRIVARGKTLNIVGVANVDERDRWTVCECKELVDV